MSEKKFTPGPWKAYKMNGVHPLLHDGICRNDSFAICETMGPDKLFNAHLIAAAPELYAALDELTHIMETDGRSYVQDSIINARAALAKARGETP